MLTLRLLPGPVVVARLEPGAPAPALDALEGPLVAVVRTDAELSLVCGPASVPPGAVVEAGWRVLRVDGPLDFTLFGVLASLAVPLAGAGVSIFALSTFDTDHLLVREEALGSATTALRAAGHVVHE